MNKPKKQPIRFTPFLTSVIVCLIAVPSARSSEPSYNGKPLSEWLLILKEGHTESGEQDAQAAIRQIGTNGIPTLVDLLGVYDDWSAKRVLSKLHNKDLTAYVKWDENPYSRAKSLRELGLNGFSILGTNAESAVPQIIKTLSYSDEAARALTLIGPKGFSALTNALNDSNSSVRDAIIRALGKEGGGDPEVIKQLLVNALKDPDTLIRLHATDILRDKASDAVITTLMPLLDASDYGNCKSAADTLGTLGPAAKVAVPKLFSVFTNVVCGTNEYLIRCLTGDLLGALGKIDPDSAKEAETFWVTNNPLNGLRRGYTTTLLPNGKELIVGGYLHAEILTTNPSLSNAELLDSKTGKWTETGQMNVARFGHTAALLTDGKVLVAGGSDGVGHDLSSAELYDPTTGQWTMTGSMNRAHYNNYATLQSDGKVLVFSGGYDGVKIFNDKQNQELYNPVAGTWTVVTNKGSRK